MSGPANAVMGDQDQPMTVPETKVPEEFLAEEKKMAQYSETAEFKRLSKFMQARIEFFQRFLPNGQRVEGDPVRVGLPPGVPMSELAAYWTAACIVIKEFEGVLGEYEIAREAVKNAGREDT